VVPIPEKGARQVPMLIGKCERGTGGKAFHGGAKNGIKEAGPAIKNATDYGSLSGAGARKQTSLKLSKENSKKKREEEK